VSLTSLLSSFYATFQAYQRQSCSHHRSGCCSPPLLSVVSVRYSAFAAAAANVFPFLVANRPLVNTLGVVTCHRATLMIVIVHLQMLLFAVGFAGRFVAVDPNPKTRFGRGLGADNRGVVA
jgi:hypothetical protein